MRRTIEADLEALRQELLTMGRHTEEAIRLAIEALRTRDPACIEEVFRREEEVDRLELAIEQRCLSLIALQQPVAGDLRAIGTALKIVTDLERMADHARDIARAAQRLGDEPLIKPLIDIPRMADLARLMVRWALDAYLRADVDLARRMIERDDELDALHRQILHELLVIMLANPSAIAQATQLMMIAQHLERMGDHATNVGEWILYMVTGERIELND